MIVRDTITNFIGGVSQQNDKLMLPNQSKALVNQLLDPVEGLKRRPPTQYVSRLCNNFVVSPYIHTIFKEDEEYQVILDGSTCKIYDLQGNEKELYISTTAQAYISSSNPLRELYAVSLADYTFILNKTKKVAYTADVHAPTYAHSALLFVKQGNFSTDYKVYLNGNEIVSYTTADDTASKIKTTAIAAALVEKLTTAMGSNYSISRSGSTILISNNTNTDFTITAEDSNGNTNLIAIQKNVDTSTDLPIIAPNNFVVKITQDAKEGADDYYVKFTTNDESNFGQGVWRECPAPNIKYKLDASTMPLALIRQADGGFTLDTIDWGERLSGDDKTAPSPSFIGNTIQEILTYKGRLGFVSVDKVIFSDTQDIFSFFKKSVLTELETDPIDITSNSKMVLLNHTLPFNEQLLLSSDTAQFSLKGGDTFSNSTVSLDLVTSYQCSKNCKPISLGSNGYFVYENGSFTRVMSLFVTQSYTIDAEDITEQCPSYIPANIYKMVGSTANHIVVLLSEDEKDSLYVYNFYMSSGERQQSAWHKWKFDNAKILNADFNYHKLYLTMQYSDGVYLEIIDFTPKKTEDNLNYEIYLDRKKYYSNLTYNSETKTTTLELPYTITDKDNFRIVDVQRGFELSYAITEKQVAIKGNHSDVVVGNCFESLWQLPILYYKQMAQSGIKVLEGILMLRDMNLVYGLSGSFVVDIVPKYTTQMESSFKFTGQICGLPSATIGKLGADSGTFLVPLITRNEDISIIIRNDSYLPSCFLSLEWIGDFVQRGK